MDGFCRPLFLRLGFRGGLGLGGVGDVVGRPEIGCAEEQAVLPLVHPAGQPALVHHLPQPLAELFLLDLQQPRQVVQVDALGHVHGGAGVGAAVEQFGGFQPVASHHHPHDGADPDAIEAQAGDQQGIVAHGAFQHNLCGDEAGQRPQEAAKHQHPEADHHGQAHRKLFGSTAAEGFAVVLLRHRPGLGPAFAPGGAAEVCRVVIGPGAVAAAGFPPAAALLPALAVL